MYSMYPVSIREMFSVHTPIVICVNEVDIVYKGWRHIYISLGVRSERAESMGIIGGSRPHSARD